MQIRVLQRTYNAEQAFVALLSLVFTIYIIVRARMVPITIDEVATIFNHTTRSLWDMVTYEKDATPNNHIFHTLLVNFTTWFLGIHHVTARIPALLGGLLYFWAARRIAALSTHSWLRIFTLVVLLGNPFLLEFFSLARGYGLASGCMLASIYFALKHGQTGTLLTLAGSSLCAFLAVWSNFTLLNFYLPYTFIMVFWLIQHHKQHLLGKFSIFLLGIGVTALATVQPIMAMRASDQFRFWSSNGFYADTLSPLVKSAVNKLSIFGPSTSVILVNLVLVFCLLGWVISLVKWVRNYGRFDQYTFVSTLFLGTVCYNVLQAIVLKVPYLDARTSLFFYPLLAMLLVSVAHWLWEKKQIAAQAFMGTVLLLIALNFIKNANFNRQTEWWFDNATFKFIEYMERLYHREKRTQPITFDCSWPMQNSFLFHINDATPRLNNHIYMAPWHPGRTYPQDTEFYCSEGIEDHQKLAENYDIVFQYPHAPVFLYQRKKKQE